MEEKPPALEGNAPSTIDVHLVNYGVIMDQDIIFMSNQQFEPLLHVVTYASSFAANIHDGRLYKIKHELGGKKHTTLVQVRIVNEKNLMYVISGSDEKLLPQFQPQLLDNLTKEIEEAIPAKRAEKLYSDKLDDYTRKMHRVADKIDQGISLIHDMQEFGDDFLVKEVDYTLSKIHYIGISTAGVPVRNRLYGKELVSLFKIPKKENVPADEIVRSLISAQFSAIINSSLIQAGTRITEITIMYTNIESMEPTQLKIVFFPIGFQGQYTLEICYQGKSEDINGFQVVCAPMLDRFLHVPFRGNLKEFELVADVLTQFPNNFDLFDHIPDEFAQPSDHVETQEPGVEETPKPELKVAAFDVDTMMLNLGELPDDKKRKNSS
jgi:hypothetical protein